MYSYKKKDNQFNVIACKEIDWNNPHNCDVHFSVHKDCKHCQNCGKGFIEDTGNHVTSRLSNALYHCKYAKEVREWAKSLEEQGLAHKSYTDGCPFKKVME